jgi:outer membrane autotransporter protein
MGLGSTDANVNSNVFNASLEASYAFLLDKDLMLSPLAGIDAAWVSQDDFEEDGAGGVGLTGDSENFNTYSTALGARLGGRWDLGAEWMGAWEVEAKWRHRFGDDVPNADLAFIGALPDGGTFRVFGPETSDDWAEVGVGFTVYSGIVDVGLRYDGALGPDLQSHALSLTAGASF